MLLPRVFHPFRVVFLVGPAFDSVLFHDCASAAFLSRDNVCVTIRECMGECMGTALDVTSCIVYQ